VNSSARTRRGTSPGERDDGAGELVRDGRNEEGGRRGGGGNGVGENRKGRNGERGGGGGKRGKRGRGSLSRKEGKLGLGRGGFKGAAAPACHKQQVCFCLLHFFICPHFYSQAPTSEPVKDVNIYSGDQLLARLRVSAARNFIRARDETSWPRHRDNLPWFVMARTDPVVDGWWRPPRRHRRRLASRAGRGVRHAGSRPRACRPGRARRVERRARRSRLEGKTAARRGHRPAPRGMAADPHVIENRATAETSSQRLRGHTAGCAGRSASAQRQGSCSGAVLGPPRRRDRGRRALRGMENA